MRNSSPFSVEVTPDVEELLQVIKKTTYPERVHHIELFLDQPIKDAIVERFDLADELPAHNGQESELAKEIAVHAFLGYDVFRLPLIHKEVFSLSGRQASDGERAWMEEKGGPIQSWADFEAYRWPQVSAIDVSAMEWMERNIPENMGVYDLTGHIFEMLSFLMGYETLCYTMYDDPDLIDALSERIGAFYMDYTRLLVDFDCVALVWASDDMGFHSTTLAPPEFLRDKVLPWHRECARIAHEAGKPYILHSCGNIEPVMEECIGDVHIDAKHSFEDSVVPVTDFFKRYGERISVLGGIDVDFLCREQEGEIRKRVRETLDVCMQSPGYCLGTGNSVASYIPIDNYLVMLDEGRRYTV